MNKFAFATLEEFEELEQILLDEQLHVYNQRNLPEGCNPSITRVGFEKSQNGYIMLIENGIQSNGYGNKVLDILLEKGEIEFAYMEDLIEFFFSIKSLFPDEDTVISKQQKKMNHSPIVDRKRLDEIKEKQYEKKLVWPEEIANPIKNSVFGQNIAIDALSEAIVINQMRKNNKLLVLALLGPPATGKSTVGRALADVLSEVYGKSYGFLEIAASEFTQEHMIQKFLGAPPSYVGHGNKTILEPIRKNKYHVILINEIEKAHEKMLLALMEAMDTGFLGMADNSPAIDLNDCILLFTSNIPIDMAEYSVASDFQKSEITKDAFTKHCHRPEISRRIQDFMVFVPLSEEAEVDVIIKFAKDALHDMDAQLVKIDEYLMADFLKCKTKYGASELGNYVTRAVSRQMLNSRNPELVKGKKITLYGTMERIEFKIDEGANYEANI